MERLTKETMSARKFLRQWVVNTSHGKASAKAKEASCWSRLALNTTVEESAPWASFLLTPASRFQLFLLYHVFPEIRRLVKDKYAYYDHYDQDQGEEDHEEDICGVGERCGQWLFRWDHVGQVQHVAQSPPDAGAPDLRTVGKVCCFWSED